MVRVQWAFSPLALDRLDELLLLWELLYALFDEEIEDDARLAAAELERLDELLELCQLDAMLDDVALDAAEDDAAEDASLDALLRKLDALDRLDDEDALLTDEESELDVAELAALLDVRLDDSEDAAGEDAAELAALELAHEL